jgi:uncharacterized protein
MKTDLLKAIRLEDVEQAIATAKSDLKVTDRDGRGAIANAVIVKNYDLVKAMIEAGHDLNQQDKAGETPLHFAARFYLKDIAALLLDSGAAIDVQDAFGNTPLWRATFEAKSRGELIRLLLERGGDRNKQNKKGVSPLELARRIASSDNLQFYDEFR